MTSPQRRKLRSRAMLIAFGAVMGLVALELVMQLVALWNWNTANREGTAADGTRVVLCVGDSFTYGLGASDSSKSYPSQLQALLDREQPGEWSVVNGGWAGQSSGDVLWRLPGQLRDHRPDTVVVLAGYNDRWKEPARVTVGELDTAAGFPLRWRTGELIGRIIDALFAGDTPSFIGSWYAPGLVVVFEPDGRLITNGEEVRWVLRDGELSLALRTGEAAVEWTVDGDSLELSSDAFAGGRVQLIRGAPPGDPSIPASGRAALDRAAREPLGPEWFAATCAYLRDHPEESELWWELAGRAASGGDRAEILATTTTALQKLAADDAWRAGLLRIRAILLVADDEDAALSAMIEAALVDGERDSAVAWIRTRDLSKARFDRVTATIADPEARRRAEAIWDTARGQPSGMREVLGEHLESIIELAQAAGAEVVVSSYPEPKPLIDDTVRAAAERGGAVFCSLHAAFATALAGQPRSALFALDGHCNDAGYALLARSLVTSLRAN